MFAEAHNMEITLLSEPRITKHGSTKKKKNVVTHDTKHKGSGEFCTPTTFL